MSSGRLADYIGRGDFASRPASLDIHPEMIALYYSEDTGEWSAWDGAAWLENIMNPRIGFDTLEDAVDDAAAATAGVPVGGMYRNGSVIMVRIT